MSFCDCEYMMHSLYCLMPGPTVCPSCEEVKLTFVEGLWRDPKWKCGSCKEISDIHPPIIENIMNRLRECGKCYWEKQTKETEGQ
jgi:hypothetical protein